MSWSLSSSHSGFVDVALSSGIGRARRWIALLVAVSFVSPEVWPMLHINLRLAVVLIGVSALILEASASNPPARGMGRPLVGVFALYCVAMLAACIYGHVGAPNSYNLERIAIELPLYLMIGFIAFRNSVEFVYVKAISVVAVVSALLALVEYVQDRSLFGRSAILLSTARAESSSVRAVVLAEHPLVLGLILCSCMPLWVSMRTRLRIPGAVLLLAGSFCTGSRGPTILAAVMLVFTTLPSSILNPRRTRRIALIAVSVAMALLFVFSVFLWKPEITGATDTTYSTNYRSALYALLPRMLLNAPLGYGLGSLPHGIYLMPSELLGFRDAADTVDSEFVLAASTFGVVGMLAVILAGYLGASILDVNRQLGTSLLVIWFGGAFLALHAWDSLGSLWYFLIGVAWAQWQQKRLVSALRQ